MNMNTNINTETIKTPSQDAQGRWYELLSPTQVLTGQQQQQEPEQPQEHDKVEKKKKCRGDRKAQRRRRRLRRKGLCADTMTKNGDQELNVQQQEQHDQIIEEDISNKIQV
ncbi:unnamed protein product, partial [Rotaria sp. Silwood2]